MTMVSGIWHGDDDNCQSYDDMRDDIERACEEVDDDTTLRLPLRESVSVEAMVALVRGAR